MIEFEDDGSGWSFTNGRRLAQTFDLGTLKTELADIFTSAGEPVATADVTITEISSNTLRVDILAPASSSADPEAIKQLIQDPGFLQDVGTRVALANNGAELSMAAVPVVVRLTPPSSPPAPPPAQPSPPPPDASAADSNLDTAGDNQATGSSSGSGDGLDGGAVAGIIIAILLAVIGGFVGFLYFRSKKTGVPVKDLVLQHQMGGGKGSKFVSTTSSFEEGEDDDKVGGDGKTDKEIADSFTRLGTKPKTSFAEAGQVVSVESV